MGFWGSVKKWNTRNEKLIFGSAGSTTPYIDLTYYNSVNSYLFNNYTYKIDYTTVIPKKKIFPYLGFQGSQI